MSSFKIRSSAFKDQAAIPVRYTFQGKSRSPAISWVGIPKGTQELALICEDHDVPTSKSFVHWMVYGIDPKLGSLPEGLKKRGAISKPFKLKQGRNSFLLNGWIGPNPGFWDPPHHYQFKLFALREPTNLPPSIGREKFYAAIQGKIIQKAEIVGTYQKTPFQRVKAVAFWLSIFGGLGFAATRLLSSSTKSPTIKVNHDESQAA